MLTAASSEKPAITKPTRTLHGLVGLRGRIRRLILVDGLAVFALAVCGVALLTFVLDYALRLPWGVRATLLLVALTTLAAAFFRRLVLPRRADLPLEDLAILVEANNPELKQSLVTAVQLTSSNNRSAPYLSIDMIERVVDEVECNLPRVALHRVLRRARTGKLLLAAVALAAFLGAVASARSDLATIWLRRNLLLGNEDWPKRVQLMLAAPTENPATVARGDDLPVEVRVTRGQLSSVEIRYWTMDGSRRDSRTELMKALPDGSFRKVFEHVSRAFVFEIRADDDELDRIDVEVEIRPKVSLVRLWCQYPEYTAKDPTPQDQPLQNGHLELAVGTQVRYEAFSNVPVMAAYFQFVPVARGQTVTQERTAADPQPDVQGAGDEPVAEAGDQTPNQPRWPPTAEGTVIDQLAPERLSLRPDEGLSDDTTLYSEEEMARGFERSRFAGEFTVTEDGYYVFHLRGGNQLVNEKPVRFRVKAIADRPPRVRLVEPVEATQEVSPTAKVPIKALIRDDYGVKNGALRGLVFRDDGTEGKEVEMAFTDEEIVGKSGEGDETSDDDPITVERVVDVASLEARVGWRFQYLVEAADHGGNIGESEQYFLLVLSEDQILRRLQNQIMVVKNQVEAMRRQQESARKDLEEFRGKAMLKEALGKSEASKLSRHRQNQQRVTRGITRAGAELSRILERMTDNGVGEEKDKDWLHRVAIDLQHVAADQSKQIEDDIGKLRAEAAAAPQKPERIPPIVDAQRGVERNLQRLARKLTDFGDLNSIIQQLRDIQRRQVEIRDKVREELHREGGTQ